MAAAASGSEEAYGEPRLDGLPLNVLSQVYDHLDAEDVCALSGVSRKVRAGYMESDDADVWKKCVAFCALCRLLLFVPPLPSALMASFVSMLL